MRINLPEEPTLSHDTVGECLGNGLLTSIGAATLAYIFERPILVPAILMFLTVSLSCLIWAWCQERQVFKVNPKESAYDDSAYDESDSELADESQYPNEAEYEEMTNDESGEGFADSHLIPETGLPYPTWFGCTVTRSLGSAKAHALFDVLLNGSINRTSFCAVTGKSQLDYPSWLQTWFDLSLLERNGKKVELTYRGEAFVQSIEAKIKSM